MEENKELSIEELKEIIKNKIQEINSRDYLEYIEVFIKLSAENWI